MAHGTRYTKAELAKMARDFDRGNVQTVGAPTVVETDDNPDRTAVMSIRLPASVIASLKSEAAAHGIGATILARRFIIEGLTTKAAGGLPFPGSVKIADLLEFAVSRGIKDPGSAPTKSAAKKATTRSSAASRRTGTAVTARKSAAANSTRRVAAKASSTQRSKTAAKKSSR